MKINRFYFLVVLILVLPLLGGFINADKQPKKESIQWLTLEEAAAKSQVAPRKILVDVYTDWCSWCRQMDKSTFSDPKVVAYVNKNFYAVKLNAEDKAPITINGKTYKFNSQYRAHEAAMALLNGQLSYPTTVYLDEKMHIITPVPGYLDVQDFSTILSYFGENHYKQQSFADYSAIVSKK
ncbi:MAG: thioredoxin [Cytophagales bacterium CG18_big_fil_WC_8_21_14_2_50_42_9]|nr:MAG: thioredoxin [Cytophagales bacterium CG18_big_fil_WC_8_21_14_2_50_42_9]